VGKIVKFYRELIDAYLAHPKEESFDLTEWQAQLMAIQSPRDAARTRTTQALLAEARQPVLTSTAPL
jgi:hypothetical protein